MIRLLFATLVASSVLAAPAFAGILKDHVSDSSLYDGQEILLQVYPESFSRTVLAGSAATFVGDGNKLSKVAGVFATNGSNGTINEGDIAGYLFRIAFFESVDAYLVDPYNDSPTGGSSLHFLKAPTNADFLEPRGTSAQGHDFLVWEFDVESLDIRTTAGKTQLLMIQPQAGLDEGNAFMAFSAGGVSAVGGLSDYFTSDTDGTGPGQLINLGAPTPFAAYRIATTVPEPQSGLLCALATLLAYARKPSRSEC